MKSRWIFRGLFAGLALATAGTAAAGNEAEYNPDGKLYVPHMKMLDADGGVIASYAAYFEKSAGWNFKLYGLANAVPATGGTATNTVTTYVTNVVVVSNVVTLTNEITLTTTNDGSNDYVVTNVVVYTNFAVYTNVTVTTNFTATSIPPGTVAQVAGTWSFYFNEHYARTFTGTEFGRTTNFSPVTFSVTLALSQTNTDVTGTGLVDSVHYALAGEVSNDLFVFTLLAGHTNRTIRLAAGQALIGDGILIGDYRWSTTGGTQVGLGDFYAEKQ